MQTARERWEEWEKRTGFERERTERERKAEVKDWAERKSGAIAERVETKLRESGGFSVRPFAEHETPTTGVMVSVPVSAGLNAKIDTSAPKSKAGPVREQVRSWIAKALPQIVNSPDTFLGGWLDSSTGVIHLDVSRRYPSDKLDQAIEQAKRDNQIAVFRLDDFKEIQTGGTGD